MSLIKQLWIAALCVTLLALGGSLVVGYYPTPDAEPLILDNLVGEIRPAGRRPDLFPVFSFTSEGLWVPGATTSSADPTARLSRWRSVLQRMRDEGLELPR